MLGRSRSRRPALPVVLAAAALALVLGGCGALPSALGPAPVPPAGAVDNPGHPNPRSATLPLIGVVQADGTRLGFVVEQARSYPKAAFPTGAVFGPVPSAALRLITCTGDFDRARSSYRDNLVVFARLAG
jgi:hypothetical protein